MASLTIEGRKVTVDDAFKTMSAEDQERTVNEIAESLNIRPKTAEPDGSGVGMNVTAGLNEMTYGTLGAPVDLMRGAMNLGVDAYNAATGSDVGYIPADSFGGSRFIAETMGAIDPRLDPKNTVAASAEERIARGVGQGVAGTVAPAGLVGGAARFGAIGPRVAEMGANLFGRSNSVRAAAGDAAAGAAAGAGSSAAIEAAPDALDPYAALAGGIVGGGLGVAATGLPRVAMAGGDIVRVGAEPLTAGGREMMAARRLQGAARATPQGDPRSYDAGGTSLQDVIDRLPGSSLVPGSMPTTFQATGNMGIGALERGVATRYADQFNQRRADQNAARVAALEGIQSTGAPDIVTKTLRDRLQGIEAEAENILTRATDGALGAAERVGQGIAPEQAGASLRGSLEAARAAAKDQERALWRAVDPDNSLTVSAANARRQAQDVLANLPASAKRPEGEEAAIYGVLGQYGDVVPFGEVTALSSRLKAEMRAERLANGETPAYRRLSQLSSAIQNDLEATVAGKVQRETDAVAAGTMRAEDTLEAAMGRQRESWLAGRQEAAGQATGTAGASGPTGFSPDGRGRPSAVPGAYGADGQARRGLSNTPRDPRLSADGFDPNFDRAAQERLAAANTATRQRAETFDNRTLGPLRRRPSTTAPYDVPAADVAARLFSSSAKSPEALAQYRTAIGNDPQGMAALEGYAIDRLRKVALRDDLTFDPNRLAAWRRSHADALRAFPELDARLSDAGRASETLVQVADTRRRTLDETQKGAIGKLMGLEDPSSVTAAVGSLFGRQDSVQQFNRLRGALGDNAQAKEGLRKAVVDHVMARFISNTEAGTSGIGTIKSDQFQTFVKQNRPALRAMFTDAEIANMEAVAADLRQANRSLTAVKIPGQSNTAQDLTEVQKTDGPKTVLAKMVARAAAVGGTAGFFVEPFTAAALGAGTVVTSAFRENGIRTVDDLVRDALLSPDRAKLLLMKAPDRGQAMVERSLATRHRAAAAATLGMAENERRKGEPLQVTVTPQPARAAGGR